LGEGGDVEAAGHDVLEGVKAVYSNGGTIVGIAAEFDNLATEKPDFAALPPVNEASPRLNFARSNVRVGGGSESQKGVTS
jgi:hypothetical protein